MGARAATPDERVKRFAQRVREAMPGARIIWFGSRARGDHLEHSDYDFIVVSEAFGGIRFWQRPKLLYEYWECGADLEALCYTPDELVRKAGEINIVSVALKEGLEV